MDKTQQADSGNEVRDQALGPWEVGFLDGVLAAWGARNPSPGELRDALRMLMAHRRQPGAASSRHPGLRLATANPRQPPPNS
jgi:hypothetical protein